ncbi:UNVERIFIED_CONTAM: hypothetical protein NY603_34255, partial [Bacteroidetes bacterium 56_B9]
MHELPLGNKLFAGGIVVVLPQASRVVSNVVDRHETHTTKKREQNEQLPELWFIDQRPAGQLCCVVMVRIFACQYIVVN